ncbi:binding-protein-dependent transport systems inner membrane component [Coriobacterium glomerans PW2]|uniref:Glutathione transport system permease protein GsiD n=1 Tax=Coriobacterium glomerans (strain ATCC 49209 / DSM 20642 / JCM 10262 / PW2) TaxID=700015 RepID=F2N8E1_CORGP|nr:ABC transporter permease subunit [Coriobacterium glomerans]AEB07324.1 binding-protein-dependent transport systems inner membrane component [Coriobacterium glomerans PW2]
MADTTTKNAEGAFAAGEELPRAVSPWRQFIKKFWRRKTAVAGFFFIVFVLVIAVIGPQITPYDPGAYDYAALYSGPSATHIWGCDEFGRDVFSRILAGTQLSIGTAVTASVLGTVVGVVLGLLAGFLGGIVDAIIMRVCDIMFAFPGMLLAMAIVAIIGPGIKNIMIGVAVFTVPTFARIIRGAVLEVRGELYVEVAKSVGCSTARTMFVHIFPGTMQALIVNFSMNVGGAILTASSLSFLGLGANVTEPEWGAILSQGRSYIATAPHLVLFPGLVIFLTVLAFNLFGDGLRDTLDPKLN